MNTATDTALRGAVGLLVLAALFITIWIARDSSARVGPVPPHPVAEPAAPARLESARTHRSSVTRTAISPEELEALRRPGRVPGADIDEDMDYSGSHQE